MSNRAYTVAEIDDLREACSMRFVFGTTNPERFQSGWRPYIRDEERHRCVEELVRTHMLAGHVARDLREADKA